MSYADVTFHHTPANQPQPDPALLNTQQPQASNNAEDSAKVNIVAHGFKEYPETTTSSSIPSSSNIASGHNKFSKGHPKHLRHGSNEAAHWLSVLKEVIIRPAVAGGLIGVGNLGIIGYSCYRFYSEPHLRRSPQALSTALASSVVLLSLEGYGVEKLRQKEDKGDVAVVSQYFRENPGMFQGLLGALNIGVLGTTAYVVYCNWNRCDRRTITAITSGILTLWAGESYLLASSQES